MKMSKVKKNKPETIANRKLEAVCPMEVEMPIKVGNRSTGYVGDSYTRTYIVTKYPNQLDPMWFANLKLTGGVTSKFSLVRKDSPKFQRTLSQSTDEWVSQAEKEGGSAYSKNVATTNALDSSVLLNLSQKHNQASFDATLSFLVKGSTLEELELKSKALITTMSGNSFMIQPASLFAKEAYLTASPYGYLDPRIGEVWSLPMSARTLANAAPFSMSSINDGSGIILGQTTSGTAVVHNIFEFGYGRFDKRSNANVGILGKSGTGKSSTLKRMGIHWHDFGASLIISDPENEFRKMVKALGGQYLDCGNTGKHKINPLEVFIKKPRVKDDDDESNFIPLSKHLSMLRVFFELMIKADAHAHDILARELDEFYAAQGITVEQEDLSHIKEWKTLSDLHMHIQDSYIRRKGELTQYQCEHYARLIDALYSMTISEKGLMWDGQTTIKLDSRVICFGTNSLIDADRSLQAAQYLLINQLRWGRIMENDANGIRTIDIHDEAHREVDPHVIATGEFLKNIAKRIRKYNGSLWIATQETIDLLADDVKRVGEPILSAMTHKFIFHADGVEADKIAETYKFSGKVKEEMLSAGTGRCIFITGDQLVVMDVDRPPKLIPLLTTTEREKQLYKTKKAA